MADVLTKKQRSYCMSRIQGRNTKPEIKLRRGLWALGLRYALHSRLPGRPDMTFTRYRTVVFVDGCYWHGCPKHFVKPKTNRSFWLKKIEANRLRDRSVSRALKARGWQVIRIWEHDIRKGVEIRLLERLIRRIQAGTGKR